MNTTDPSSPRQADSLGTTSAPERQAEPVGIQRFFPVLIVVAGLCAYHNCFSGAFLFDDDSNIASDPTIREWWPFETELTLPPARALVTLSLALNYGLGGLDLWGYHALNLAIHILAALVLYGVVRRTLLLEPQRSCYQQSAPWLALAVALLWVVHPLQTESVTYIIQRAESLMGLWYLLTLYCVLRGAQSAFHDNWYAGAVVSCALGMLSKEVMCTAPVLVLLYDRVFLAPSWAQLFRQRWHLYLGLAATWALLAGTVIGLVSPNGPPGTAATVGLGIKGLTPAAYALSQPGVIVHYVMLTFWPDPLCIDYGWHVADTAASVVQPGLAIGVMLVATLWAWRRWPGLGYCGAWFFLILAPTSSIVPMADLAFEHRMYLSLAAVAVLVVLGGHALLAAAAPRLGLGRKAYAGLAGGLVLALVVLLGWRTVRRNADYHDPVSMWGLVVAQRPHHARGYGNLGASLAILGKFPEAEQQYRTALQLSPNYIQAHCSLGGALGSQRKFEEAVEEFRTALAMRPGYAEAHSGLGACLLHQGKLEEAEQQCRAALHFKPAFSEGHGNLGACLMRQGKAEEAEQELRAALRIKPDYAEAHYNLGSCLLAQGKREEALAHFRVAQQINPGLRPPNRAPGQDARSENPPSRR
jgi:Flp pilus assembly protein TadD